MAGEWARRPLGELAANLDSRRVPLSSREREQRRGPYPYYGATGVMDYVDNFLFEGLHLLVAEDGSVERPDGRPFVQLVDGQFWVNNHAHVLKGATDDETRYLYYALQTVPVRPFVSGSVQAKLSQANLNRIPIPYPADGAERRAIAHILGTLDDKIELNRRVSETLEAMARALFKAWFVDFEPVCAKRVGAVPRGRPDSGQPQRVAPTEWQWPQHILDLFPDRLVDSELGEMPEGWEVGTLGDLAEVTSGKRPDVRHSEPTQQATVPVWGGNGPMGFVPESLFDQPILITGRVGTLGSVFRVTTPCWPSDNTLVVRANEATSFEYLFHQLQQVDFASLNRGSTQPLLTQSDLKGQLILVPQRDVLKVFRDVVGLLYKRVDELEKESRVLAALRDALLPKLISGELRVKDAERFLQERGL